MWRCPSSLLIVTLLASGCGGTTIGSNAARLQAVNGCLSARHIGIWSAPNVYLKKGTRPADVRAWEVPHTGLLHVKLGTHRLKTGPVGIAIVAELESTEQARDFALRNRRYLRRRERGVPSAFTLMRPERVTGWKGPIAWTRLDAKWSWVKAVASCVNLPAG